MNKEIFLIVMLSISLVGMTFVENSFADAGTQFHSTFGKHGISQPGFFLNPQSMAFDSENNLYITDLGNSRVQKFDSNGNLLWNKTYRKYSTNNEYIQENYFNSRN